MAGGNFQTHPHDSAVHEHERIHVTHHAKGGNPGAIERLMASHAHVHNRSPVQHAHTPNESPQREHEHEEHIHDYSHSGGDLAAKSPEVWRPPRPNDRTGLNSYTASRRDGRFSYLASS